MSSSPDSLQLAQVLADLNSLQNTDPDAAHALLRANKTLAASRSLSRKSRASIQPDAAAFDYLGRRIKSSKAPGFSRQGSSVSTTGSGEGSGTASPGSGRASGILPTEDEDMLKAAELVSLYNMRPKFKQMGDTGLTRARERVDAVVKYALQEQKHR